MWQGKDLASECRQLFYCLDQPLFSIIESPRCIQIHHVFDLFFVRVAVVTAGARSTRLPPCFLVIFCAELFLHDKVTTVSDTMD